MSPQPFLSADSLWCRDPELNWGHGDFQFFVPAFPILPGFSFVSRNPLDITNKFHYSLSRECLKLP